MTSHHAKAGFRNPWPIDTDRPNRAAPFLRWRWERIRTPPEPSPPAGSLGIGTPDVAHPCADDRELRITWIGHSTFLVQIGALNVLTDPMFSDRASPVPWAGPRRLRPPAVALRDLPEIHAVLLSHDHFDHLDVPSVRGLVREHPQAEWLAPLGFADWLKLRGVTRAHQLDWWQAQRVGTLGVTALPAQHWCSRGPLGGGPRLWCSWEVRSATHSVYFAGDSGYSPAYREIATRRGRFDALLMPIGAYEPRWFMRPAHMNPEEAVRAYRDLGGTGHFFGMHWGTFRLSDEPFNQPPELTRAAWNAAGLPPALLHVDPPGHTVTETQPLREAYGL